MKIVSVLYILEIVIAYIANQYIWVGIAIGVFIAGLGIGFAINQYTVTPNMMAQNMQQMMQNPSQR